jgi:hypothetical protein
MPNYLDDVGAGRASFVSIVRAAPEIANPAHILVLVQFQFGLLHGFVILSGAVFQA